MSGLRVGLELLRLWVRILGVGRARPESALYMPYDVGEGYITVVVMCWCVLCEFGRVVFGWSVGGSSGASTVADLMFARENVP